MQHKVLVTTLLVYMHELDYCSPGQSYKLAGNRSMEYVRTLYRTDNQYVQCRYPLDSNDVRHWSSIVRNSRSAAGRGAHAWSSIPWPGPASSLSPVHARGFIILVRYCIIVAPIRIYIHTPGLNNLGIIIDQLLFCNNEPMHQFNGPIRGSIDRRQCKDNSHACNS